MISLDNKTLLFQVIAAAIVKSHQEDDPETCHLKVKAIARAVRLLEDDSIYALWEPFNQRLAIWSVAPFEMYSVTNACQCLGFLKSPAQFCEHLALKTLVEDYHRRLPDEPPVEQIDFAEAVFFNPDMSTGEKICVLGICVAEGRTELAELINFLSQETKPVSR